MDVNGDIGTRDVSIARATERKKTYDIVRSFVKARGYAAVWMQICATSKASRG